MKGSTSGKRRTCFRCLCRPARARTPTFTPFSRIIFDLRTLSHFSPATLDDNLQIKPWHGRAKSSALFAAPTQTGLHISQAPRVCQQRAYSTSRQICIPVADLGGCGATAPPDNNPFTPPPPPSPSFSREKKNKKKTQRFLPEISEAYPEVPWIFVFRDPVEVMVSNLKSLAGAPCVRIPRQEKLRKSSKIAKRPKGKSPPGKAGLIGAPLGDNLRERFQGHDALAGKAWGGGDRRLAAGNSGAGGSATVLAMASGEGEASSLLLEDGSAVLWEGGYDEEEGDCDPFDSVSWNGDFAAGGGGGGSCSSPVEDAFALELGEGEERWRRRRLVAKRTVQQLTMNMTMECADWLKVGGRRGVRVRGVALALVSKGGLQIRLRYQNYNQKSGIRIRITSSGSSSEYTPVDIASPTSHA